MLMPAAWMCSGGSYFPIWVWRSKRSFAVAEFAWSSALEEEPSRVEEQSLPHPRQVPCVPGLVAGPGLH